MSKVGLLLLAVLLFGACTDEDETRGRHKRQFSVVLGSPSFSAATRALPANFVPYGSHYTTLPARAQIQIYIASAGTSQPIVGILNPTDVTAGEPPVTTRTWSSNFQVDADGTYYVYGFLPKESMNNVNIAAYNGNYSNGAVLTINGLSAITSDDLCVIVGVKGYTPADEDNPVFPAIDVLQMDMRLGRFDAEINADKNYAYMLVDHIFCDINFDIKVSEKYSQLRTIKVKSIRLRSYTSSDQSLKTVSATVTLAANNQQRNPLLVDGTVRSVYVNIDETGYLDTPAMLYGDAANPTDGSNPLVLTTSPHLLQDFYAPAANQVFALETVYDVYDRYGNLVRENQTAVNRFQPAGMVSGYKYTYHITVGPTYLYSLSEKDLDNPTINIVATN